MPVCPLEDRDEQLIVVKAHRCEHFKLLTPLDNRSARRDRRGRLVHHRLLNRGGRLLNRSAGTRSYDSRNLLLLHGRRWSRSRSGSGRRGALGNGAVELNESIARLLVDDTAVLAANTKLRLELDHSSRRARTEEPRTPTSRVGSEVAVTAEQLLQLLDTRTKRPLRHGLSGKPIITGRNGATAAIIASTEGGEALSGKTSRGPKRVRSGVTGVRSIVAVLTVLVLVLMLVVCTGSGSPGTSMLMVVAVTAVAATAATAAALVWRLVLSGNIRLDTDLAISSRVHTDRYLNADGAGAVVLLLAARYEVNLHRIVLLQGRQHRAKQRSSLLGRVSIPREADRVPTPQCSVDFDV